MTAAAGEDFIPEAEERIRKTMVALVLEAKERGVPTTDGTAAVLTAAQIVVLRFMAGVGHLTEADLLTAKACEIIGDLAPQVLLLDVKKDLE